MKLYLDEDLSPRVARGLRDRGVDATSANEVSNRQLTDAEQLAYAAGQNRVMVTRNARHFVHLAREAIRARRPHAGILLCSSTFSGASVGQLVKALDGFVKGRGDGMGSYDVLYL